MDLKKELSKYLDLKSDKGMVYLKGSGYRVRVKNIDKDLALLLGLWWGDGWLLNRTLASKNWDWRIGIVEDDIELLKEFDLLVKHVFNIAPNFHDRKTKIEVYFSNRIVYEILNRIFGFPDGMKRGKLKIPTQVLKNEELATNFLKGLFSTDGKFGIYNNYPRIGMDSATKKLIEDVKIFLKKLGFNPRTYVWNRKGGNKLFGLYLYGKKEVKLFYEKIGFIGEKRKRLGIYINNIIKN